MSFYDDFARMLAETTADDPAATKRKAGWLGPVGTAAGAGIGFLAGGPPGAVAGAGIGSQAGGVAEDAVNKTLSIEDLLRVAGMLGSQIAPFNIGFQGGGVVPSQDVLEMLRNRLDLLGNQTPEQLAGPVPVARPLAQASHPGWEAFGSILSDVVSKLPAPQEGPGYSRKIGAWTPAIGAAIGGPGRVVAGRRGAANAVTAEQNKQDEEAYRTRVTEAGKSLREHRFKLVEDAMKGPGAGRDADTPLTAGEIALYQLPPAIKTRGQLNDFQQNRDFDTRVEAQRAASAATKQAAADKKLEDDTIIENTASDIASFTIPPELSSSSRAFMLRNRIVSRVNQLLKERGQPYTYDELVRLSGQQKAFQQNTANSQRFSQLRASGQTVLQHLNQWDELWKLANEKLKFSGFKPTNEIVFNLARNGALGNEAQAYAVALGDVTSPAVAREAAYVLSGGYAPYEMDVEKAHAMVVPWLGSKAHFEQYKAFRNLLRARLKAAERASPFAQGRGGASNPYLLEPSPLVGWEDDGGGKKKSLDSYEGK